MYCEKTSLNKFSIQDLTSEELELLQEGLVVLKSQHLTDPETFENERRIMVEMYQHIDAELMSSR